MTWQTDVRTIFSETYTPIKGDFLLFLIDIIQYYIIMADFLHFANLTDIKILIIDSENEKKPGKNMA